MIIIKKNTEPKEWTKYRNTPGVDYKSIPELVHSLLDEQGYICAYCMRRIPHKDYLFQGSDRGSRQTQEDHRIEHIKCREKYDNLKLDYSNMVICCPGHIGKEDHCDRSKKDCDISFSPMCSSFINTLKYGTDGTIVSSNKDYDNELNEILNLNTSLLKLNRKSVLDEVIKNLNSKRKPDGKWNKHLLKTYLKKYSEKHLYKANEKADIYQFYPYCGIVIWCLKKKLSMLKEKR